MHSKSNALQEDLPLPPYTEVLATVANCEWFSRLDLDRSHTQVNLDNKSAKILTIKAHRSLFGITRLPFGISTVPCIFQLIMGALLSEPKGVVVYLDAILIGGKTAQEMWRQTKAVLQLMQDAGLR